MLVSALAALAFSIAAPLEAGTVNLCIENTALLDSSALQVFRAELGSILATSQRTAVFTDCAPGVITITMRQQPPAEETSALGGIRHVDGRLTPQIDLFTRPVVRMVGSSLPAVVGRALARIATHEIGHWITQSAGHADCGVMMQRLTAAHLMGSGRSFFRLPPPSD